MVARPSCETKSQGLFSLFYLLTFLTSEDRFEDLWETASLTSSPASSLSSFLLASSALSCYEGSSIKSLLLSNFSDTNLSFVLNTTILFEKFPYFFLNEAFTKDLELSLKGQFFSETFGIAALYRFLSYYDRNFFHREHSFFLFYASLPLESSSLLPAFCSISHKNLLASRALAFFLKDQKQGFLFKTGDHLFTPFISKHYI